MVIWAAAPRLFAFQATLPHLHAGGGCGVGVGLGWGWGAAHGSHYIQVDPEFETKDKRPRWLRQLQDQVSVLKYQRQAPESALRK